jgi:heme-degrading monooxygenase HmoA
MIVRMWRGWVLTDRADEYADYINRTGMAEYRQTPGNIDAQMWIRALGDGRSEVVTVSWWESLDVIKGFAGDDISKAVLYPEDAQYLIGHEETVTHFEQT